MAGSNKSQELAEHLKRGPSYLFLGQDWLKAISGQDLFLTQALRKFGKPDLEQRGYSTLLQTAAGTSYPESISWLHDRCTFIPIPEPFEIISEFPWSGVTTSAIDDVLVRSLRKPWREVQKITTKSYQATDPRSRTKLHLWCLFGNVASPDSDGWPPLTHLSFVARKATATVLADTIPEMITSLGVLIIEGYEPSTDWFAPEAVYQTLSNLNPGQGHFFSAREEHRSNVYLQALASEGKLLFHEQTLAQFLAEAASSGWLQLGQTPAEAEFGHNIRVNGQSVVVPDQIKRGWEWSPFTEQKSRETSLIKRCFS